MNSQHWVLDTFYASCWALLWQQITAHWHYAVFCMYLYLLFAQYPEVVLPGATNLVDEMSSGFTKSEPWRKFWWKDWGDKVHPKSGEQTRPFHQRDNQLMAQDETKSKEEKVVRTKNPRCWLLPPLWDFKRKVSEFGILHGRMRS